MAPETNVYRRTELSLSDGTESRRAADHDREAPGATNREKDLGHVTRRAP